MKHVFLGCLALFCFFVATPAYAQIAQEVPSDIVAELQELERLEGELEALSEGSRLPDVYSEEVRGTIVNILSETEVDGVRNAIFAVQVGEDMHEIDTSLSLLDGLRYRIEVGNEVYIQRIFADGELMQVFLVDIVRTPNLLWIIVAFALMSIAVGGWRGLSSLFGLAITLGVLFFFVLPLILKGYDPVMITVFGSAVILAVNMHLSHGFSRGTALAYGATLCGLVLAWFFGGAFVAFAKLSGMGGEDAILLQYQQSSIGAPTGILLAGIILGAVGVLDDIAITQAETVSELREANANLDRKELFKRAMRVGRHHIASTVNTLVLAYAGVALPLLLLFLVNPDVSGIRLLNEEMIADEVVRTLAGTMALILTVPIATWFATYGKKE